MMVNSRKIISLITFFIFYFLFTLLSLLTPKSISAEWTKLPQNPILRGTSGLWDSRDIMSGSILLEDNLYKLWYTGNNGSGWRVGYAFSQDGLTSWNKNSTPVLNVGSSDGWEQGSGDPFVIHDLNGYRMWFTAGGIIWQYGPDRFRGGYATSTNETNWQKATEWILRGTPNAWDSGGTTRGISVVKTPKGYEMWYVGVNDGYMGTSQEKWGIGYAFSTNGISWEKYPDPVILPTKPWEHNYVSYPNVIYDGNLYHMWYTTTDINLPINIAYAFSSDGKNWIKPDDINPLISRGPSGSFDSVYVCSPVPVLLPNNQIRLYYSGFNGSNWSIGVAEGTLPNIPPPTPKLDPIIILPGLGASWNHENMILGIGKSQSDWYMTPGVKIYDGLIETLKNSGYKTEGDEKNLFVFNYNWTQPVDVTINELKTFIDEKVKPTSDQKIDLIGHSLGGLTARIFYQKYSSYPIDQIITLGSPHQGAVQVYYAWEGGDIARSLSGWPIEQRIGMGLIYQIRSHYYDTAAETAHREFPVIKDLLPTFDYLKQDNQPKTVNLMTEQNTYIATLNNQTDTNLLNSFFPLSGILNDPDNTIRWINVISPNWLEKILQLWPDGKPVGVPEYGDGDNTVLHLSAFLTGSSVSIFNNFDHLDLVTNTQSQEKILDTLNLPKNTIVPGSKMTSPALVFQLASPATIAITDTDGNIFENNNNLIIIPQAKNGIYQFKLTGTGDGVFHLYTGQLTEGKDYWSEITGKITTSQIVNWQFKFDNNQIDKLALIDQNNTIYKNDLLIKISDLEKLIQLLNLSAKNKKGFMDYLSSLKSFINKNNYQDSLIISALTRQKTTDLQFKQLISDQNSQSIKNSLTDLEEEIISLYINKTSVNNKIINSRTVQVEITLAKNALTTVGNKINRLTNDYRKKQLAFDYLIASNRLDRVESSLLTEKHINAFSSNLLLLNIVSLLN